MAAVGAFQRLEPHNTLLSLELVIPLLPRPAHPLFLLFLGNLLSIAPMCEAGVEFTSELGLGLL